MWIKRISTQRLLKLYRILRQNMWSRDPERSYTEEHYQQDWEDQQLLEQMKAELDTREHVVRKPKKGANRAKKLAENIARRKERQRKYET